MNHSQISLKTLVKNIENNHYLILDFQGRRNFVWDVLDIEKLGDSIIRGVPITSIVTMPIESKNLPTKRLNNALTSNLKPAPQQYVIDGYQRMASISDIFLSTDSTFLYYFDMLAILNEKFLKTKAETSALTTYLVNQEKAKGINDEFCKSFKEESIQFTSRFLLASSVISNEFSRQMHEFLRELEELNIITSEDEFDECLDYLLDIFTSLSHYDVASTVISSGSSKNFVEKTYEKLNMPQLGY